MSDPIDQPSASISEPADLSLVTSLSQPLRFFALAAFPPDEDFPNGNADNNGNVASQQRFDQLEISLRSHLLHHLVEELIQYQHDTPSYHEALERLCIFLKDVTLFTLAMVQLSKKQSDTNYAKIIPHSYKHASSSTFQKMPLLLLGDATTSLPLSTMQKLWSSLPHLSPFHPHSGYAYSTLCHPDIFTVSTRPIFVRACNHLLKHSSNRGVHAEFAGSVMIILSHVLPLSDRSAMNVLGWFNVENVTVFEDREEFDRGAKSRGGGWSRIMVDNEEEGQACDHRKGEIQEAGFSQMEKSEKALPSLGYEFYRTFWGVQKIFTDPQGTLVASKGGLSEVEASSAYNGFLKDIKNILEAFENTPTISSSTSIIESTSGVKHHKYLTSSQLLNLQLKDPELRTHFLTQLIIILSHINSSSMSLPLPPIALTSGIDINKLNDQVKQTQLSQLVELEKRAQQILLSIKSSGEMHWKAIQWILNEREPIWRDWKKLKCMPPMDKMKDTSGKVTGSHIRTILNQKKRKPSDVECHMNGSKDTIHIDRTLPSITTAIAQSVPKLDVFLEHYIEALDPDAEVDAEYHPENNKLYCWRALRLLARTQEGEGQLRRFSKLRRKDGNFEGIVRSMCKEEKGFDIPGTYLHSDDDEFQFDQHKDEEIDMDDISVGTPDIDESMKKDQLSKFEKAAMEVEEEILFAADASDESIRGQVGVEDKSAVSTVRRANGTKEELTKDTEVNSIMVRTDDRPVYKTEEMAAMSSLNATFPIGSCPEVFGSLTTDDLSQNEKMDANPFEGDEGKLLQMRSPTAAKFTPRQKPQLHQGESQKFQSKFYASQMEQTKSNQQLQFYHQQQLQQQQDYAKETSNISVVSNIGGMSQCSVEPEVVHENRLPEQRRVPHQSLQQSHLNNRDKLDKRDDRIHSQGQGGGRGGWEPPSHGGRTGVSGHSRVNVRDDRRGGRGRR